MGKKWTEAQRKKFSATMKRVAAKKKEDAQFRLAKAAGLTLDEVPDMDPKFNCRYCGRGFRSSSGRLYHEKHAHKKEKGVRSNAKPATSNETVQTPDADKTHRLEVATAYLWGHVELLTHSIASQYDVTFDELTRGLAAVIRAKAVR